MCEGEFQQDSQKTCVAMERINFDADKILLHRPSKVNAPLF